MSGPDAAFWDAVEAQDLGELVRTLEVDEEKGASLSEVLPTLSSWRRRSKERATVDAWRFRAAWRPVEWSGHARLTGTWWVVVPTGHAESSWVVETTQMLTRHGVGVVTVELSADDADRTALAERLTALGAVGDDAPTGVLSFLAWDGRRDPRHRSLPLGVRLTLALAQAWVDLGSRAPLWCLTHGAVSAASGDAPADPVQAQLWGLGRVVALEHPGSWGGLIDLPPEPDASSLTALLRVPVDGGGEDQVAVRGGGVLVRRMVGAATGEARPDRRWQPRGTALITGGTGSLAPRLARRLAESGAEHLVLVSRSGADAPGAAELSAELSAAGVQVTVAACDVSDREAVAALLARLRAEGHVVRTVLHTAAYIELAPFAGTTAESFDAVLAAKVDGTEHLAELLDAEELDAFVLFSSIAGFWGSGDHAAYAAANAALDAWAERGRARGLPMTSVAWGVWEDAVNTWRNLGDTDVDATRERVRRQGLPLMRPESALAALEQALDHDDTFVAVSDIDWERFVPLFTAMRPSRLLAELPAARSVSERSTTAPAHVEGQAGEGPVPGAELRQKLDGLSQADAERVLLERVDSLARTVLGHGGTETLSPDRAFKDLGFESLTAVELRNRLNRETGLRLPATLVFDRPTPRALVGHLRELLLPRPEEEAAEDHRSGTADQGRLGDDEDAIAIVGMACRFPGGVDSPESLWRLLAEGGDAVSSPPAARGWTQGRAFGVEDPGVLRGGFLADVSGFDAAFFGIGPREALAMDPQQRLLLETTWEAFERAGIDPASLRGSRTGAFIGAMGHGYGQRSADAPQAVQDYVITGGVTSVISGRLAYTFGLEGPAVTVDTACSSSLVALHLAVRSLRSNESTMALAGGVVVMPTPDVFVGFGRMGALAKDARCKAFSDDADGFGLAEGAGVVLLERLSDARRNGHRVLAVVRGSAINQDGASNGLAAPNGPSQERVIRAALADAGVAPEEVDAVEAHGTGTRLGDPIEAQALLTTYGAKRPAERPLRLGSLKSNIGHTQAAAGIAGVMKMVLALQHGVLPSTLHVTEPTTHVDWSDGTMEVLTEQRDWPKGGRPRRAGVSAFGISGTNAHVVLEEAPEELRERVPVPGPASASGPTEGASVPVVSLLLSARDGSALRAQAGRLAAHLRETTDDVREVAHALTTQRAFLDHRAVILGNNRDELLTGLDALAAGEEAPGVITGSGQAERPVFVFPGQGSQWAGMAHDLLNTSQVFRDSIAACEEALNPHVDWSLTDVLRSDEPITRVDVIQPVLFAVMVSLADLWRSLGVQPAAVIGHSQGEIAAAVVSGALTLRDGAKIAALRSQALRTLSGTGGMASLPLSPEDTTALLEPWASELSIAAHNGPHTTVIAGDAEALDQLLTHCEEKHIRARRIDVDYASHTHHIDTLKTHLATSLTDIEPRPSTIPFYSTVTGTTHDTTQLTGDYWYTNLRQPVHLTHATQHAHTQGHTAYIEISPHPILTPALHDTLEPHPVLITSTLQRNKNAWHQLLTNTAHTTTHGITTHHNHTTTQPTHHINLPTYPFQRTHYWLDSAPAPDALVRSAGLASAEHPLLAVATTLPDGATLHTGTLATGTHPWLADHAVWDTVLLPGTGLLDLTLHAAQHAGTPYVEELTLHAPLVLGADEVLTVHVRTESPADDGSRALTVHSTADHRTWTLHATAVLSPAVPEADAADATASGAWAGAWPPAGAEPVPVEGLYERLAEEGLRYGPVFRGLRQVWRRGAELYAEVRLPQEAHADAERFRVHPALLDAALHPHLVDGVDRVRLPFAWRGIALHALGATELRVRLAPEGPESLSLSVADAGGSPVATVSSLAVRPVERERLAAAARGAVVAESLYEPVWREVSGRTGAAAQRTVVVPADALDDDGHPEEVATGLLDAAAGAEEFPEVVVVPCGWSAHPSPVPDRVDLAVRRVIALLRAWAADARFGASRLVLLTRGAVAVREGEGVVDLAAAAVWGAVRSAQAEFPGRLLVVDAEGGTASGASGDADGSAGLRAALAAVAAEGDDGGQYAMRGGRLFVPRLVRLRPATPDLPRADVPAPDGATAGAEPWDAGRTVLITGGTGTLGSLVARHLVRRHGVRHLLLLGRRGPEAPGADGLCTELRELGAEVTVAACDVSDRAALAEVLGTVPADRPLGAVVHAAGTLEDGTVESLTAERVSAVLGPKVAGAWHLHELTRELGLTRFVLFSAAGGMLGNGGQANYAAANACLDALARFRRGQGLPGHSLAWGLWAEASGLTGRLDTAGWARMRRAGVLPLSSADGLGLLDRALGEDRAVVVPIRLDLTAVRDGGGIAPVLRDLAPGRGLPRAAASGGAPPAEDDRLLLAGLTPGERAHALEELVCRQAATVLGHSSADAVRPTRGFLETGFDSLRAVELRNRLGAVTGLRLPATLIFDHPTPGALAAHLDVRLQETEGGAPAGAATGLADGVGPVTGAVTPAAPELELLEKALVASGLLGGAAAGPERERVSARLRGLLERLDAPHSEPAEAEDAFADASLEDILDIVDDELRRS
ncbi:SDR family NAD(P)-dependent oxidoreductase [Streptomyces chumphonensis]|uniref:SDR family NAD(P)-dependent oxidoreductase n=1 Tax=Streptomyces chumphonensis TaxID=1214925 RepID=UPI003D70DEEC